MVEALIEVQQRRREMETGNLNFTRVCFYTSRAHQSDSRSDTGSTAAIHDAQCQIHDQRYCAKLVYDGRSEHAGRVAR